MNKLIAVVGMSGSGKGLVSDHLEGLGFEKIYFGGVVINRIKELGLEVNPENERNIREALRAEHGMGVMAKLLLPAIEEAYKQGNVVLDGLYSWDEYVILKDKFKDDLNLICIITDKTLRHDRVGIRIERPFNKEQIQNRDTTEIENLAKGGPIAIADYFVFNNGTMEESRHRIDEILKTMDEERVEK